MHFKTMARRSFKWANIALVSAALVLTGCTALPTTQEMAVTQDECTRFRTPFTEIAAERKKRIERYAAIGATVGAVVGQQAARRRNENPIAGALVGALAGAALGATGGYLSDLQKRSSTTAGLQKTVAGDASRDLRQTDALVVAMTSLNRCRLEQISKVERSVRAGGSRSAATAQIRSIRQKVDVDNRIIRSVVGDLTRTRNLYIGALKQTGADTDGYVASIQRYKPQATTPQQTALRVDTSRRPKTGNPVAKLGYAEKELSAGAEAHAKTIDAAIDRLDAMLI